MNCIRTLSFSFDNNKFAVTLFAILSPPIQLLFMYVVLAVAVVMTRCWLFWVDLPFVFFHLWRGLKRGALQDHEREVRELDDHLCDL